MTPRRPKQKPAQARRVELLTQLDQLNAVLARLGALPLIHRAEAETSTDAQLQTAVKGTNDQINTLMRAMKGHTA